MCRVVCRCVSLPHSSVGGKSVHSTVRSTSGSVWFKPFCRESDSPFGPKMGITFMGGPSTDLRLRTHSTTSGFRRRNGMVRVPQRLIRVRFPVPLLPRLDRGFGHPIFHVLFRRAPKYFDRIHLDEGWRVVVYVKQRPLQIKAYYKGRGRLFSSSLTPSISELLQQEDK